MGGERVEGAERGEGGERGEGDKSGPSKICAKLVNKNAIILTLGHSREI